MVGTIVYQLTRNQTPEQIKKAGFDAYFIDHTTGIYPVDASGVPFNAATFDSTGDSIADIHEDMAADAATPQEQPKFKSSGPGSVTIRARRRTGTAGP